MATTIRKTDPTLATLATLHNANVRARLQTAPGSTKLVAFTGRNGAGNIADARVAAGDRIVSIVKDSDGTSAAALFTSPIAADGQIAQSSATDLSAATFTALVRAAGDCDKVHTDVTEVTVTRSAVGGSGTLAECIALLNEERAVYEFHRLDTLAHLAADSTNDVTEPEATDQTTANALANDLKAQWNAHRTQSGVHLNNASTAITASDATNLASLRTLVDAIRTRMLADFADAPSSPAMLRVLPL